MHIPLSVLLYAYSALLLVWLFFMLAGAYHMFRFGFKGWFSYSATAFFIIIACLMLAVSAYAVSRLDWQAEATLFGTPPGEQPEFLGF